MLQPCALASYSELEDVIQDEVLASFFKSTDLIWCRFFIICFVKKDVIELVPSLGLMSMAKNQFGSDSRKHF